MSKIIGVFFYLVSLFVLSTISISAQVKLVPHRINLKNGKSFNLNLPADYEITPAAEGLKRIRFFAKSPDGRIFVTDMHDLTDNEKGVVYILDGWDKSTGKFSKVTPYMSNLKNPNSVQFYTDKTGRSGFIWRKPIDYRAENLPEVKPDQAAQRKLLPHFRITV